MKKLFVGNLPWGAREEDLRQLVEGEGIACEKVEVVLEQGTDRSRGFGFLHFDDDGAAEEAATLLNGRDMGGRSLRVEVAVPRGGGGGRGRRDDRGRGRRDDEGGRVDRRGRSSREW
jgi:RNA recognition motif-containing protein